MNRPYYETDRKSPDLIDFPQPTHSGLQAFIRDDVPIGKFARALASEGLAFTATGGLVVIHPQEGK